MLDVNQLLEEIKQSPYTELDVRAPHTGVVRFAKIKPGAMVQGPSGSETKKKGTVLAQLTREHNTKPITAPEKGEVVHIESQLNEAFVQAGQPLMRIRHYLTRDDVIEMILQKALSLFKAPEKAKYYFTPEVDVKIKASGGRKVKIKDGMDVFIASRMKRETPLAYRGPEGIIYAVYFQHGESIDAEAPLIGVCPEDQLGHIRDVVAKIRTEWQEPQ